VAIDHADGWQTRYYHLKNVSSSLEGRTVQPGERIGDAGAPPETCGDSNFLHVHFSLYRNGIEQPIDGTSIGGYTVHQTGDAYCGYWTRDSDGAIVADSRTTCAASAVSRI
jgi:murein DD-endopeptidase MepM/ murein hydrolase activator NlpD